MSSNTSSSAYGGGYGNDGYGDDTRGAVSSDDPGAGAGASIAVTLVILMVVMVVFVSFGAYLKQTGGCDPKYFGPLPVGAQHVTLQKAAAVTEALQGSWNITHRDVHAFKSAT